MEFNMTSPCKDCPFIRGSSTNITLHKARIPEIIHSLRRGESFPCHKTTDKPRMEWEHCAGALLFLEREDRPNQMMRIYERFGGYDRTKLKEHPDLINEDGE